jgi:hypothetical protein
MARLARRAAVLEGQIWFAPTICSSAAENASKKSKSTNKRVKSGEIVRRSVADAFIDFRPLPLALQIGSGEEK